MRIDSNLPLQRGTETEKSNKSSVTDKFRSSRADESTELGGDSVTLSSLASKALESPEVRQDKVDSLRSAIQNGSYSVDPDQIADAMISNFNA
ncbi:MAG TPA: flagellar biosynthesis anti-sigma factor FlgM [Terriglobales bacterium]|jgi:negative regulator of flagellin synthesis FlgM